MIESKRQRIRRVFDPLTVMTSVKCTTPMSPPTQVFDTLGTDGTEFTPDRGLFPTVLEPEVSASAPDGTWPNGNANAKLANVKWYSNGKDITLDPGWEGLYTVHTADDERKGSIEIRRNVGVGEVFQLHMEADLVDSRTSRTIRVSTDPVAFVTTTRSGDGYSLDMEEGAVVYYDPVADRLALDDFNRAHGLRALTAQERDAVAQERSSYLRDLPIRLMRGSREVETSPDIAYRVFRMSADRTLIELGKGFDEIVGRPVVGRPIRIDMRLTGGACYMVKAMLGALEIARTQFHVKRKDSDITLEIHNAASISCSDRNRIDVATAKCGEEIVCQPDRLMRIKWKTETAVGVRVLHNSGSVGHIDLERAGATEGSGDLSVWCEGEMRGAHRFVKGNGKYLRIGSRPVIMN